MATYKRSCDVSWKIVTTEEGGGVRETYLIFPWTVRGKSWLSHNDARRDACKKAKKCLAAAWKQVDKVGSLPPKYCEGIGYVRPKPGLTTLRRAITQAALDAVNPASGRLSISVYGRVNGDNGCGGKGLKTQSDWFFGKYIILDVLNPDNFRKVDE